MLNAVIKLSLRYRPLVVVACLALLGYGGYLATTLPIDVFPDLDRPRVTVLTECPGLAPEEVETLVTYPMESALLGANGVRDVRTQSGFGLSSVVVEFGWGTDMRTARQVVQERLATVAGDLPPDLRPQMAPPGAIMGQIVLAGLTRRKGPTGGELAAVPGTPFFAERLTSTDNTVSLKVWKPIPRNDPKAWPRVEIGAVTWDETTPIGGQRATTEIDGVKRVIPFLPDLQKRIELRTLADWVVRPRLQKVAGVAQVLTVGGGRKQYHVVADPVALSKYGVSLRELEEALRANNGNATGGFVERGELETPVRVIARLGPDAPRVIADLKKIPVRSTDKRTILLEQVSRVEEGAQVKRGDASVNGEPGVIITVVKQAHADTRSLTDAIESGLKEIEPSLPADVAIEPSIYQLRGFIDRGVANVGEALIIGAVLVLIVLFLFLLNVRTTFISLTAIPLSLVITAVVFKAVGWISGVELSINVMTLGGIAVAMGELVDDAIVDVENIFRRLRDNSHSANPKPPLRVVYEASREVRTAIVFGTAVVILVFLPLFALSGIEGRLFAPLGVAYIVSILASLLVSLTVTPVLSYYLLAHSKAVHREKDGVLLRGLKWMAGHLVRLSTNWAGILLLLTWVVVGYCGWRLTTLGADFLPAFDEGTVQVNVSLPAGSSVEASNRVSEVTDRVLARFRMTDTNPEGEVLAFGRRTGRSEMDEHADPPNENEFFVTVNPHCGKTREQVLELIQSAVKEEVAGVDVEVEQPLAHLISHLISGSTAQIAIKIYGDDLDTLGQVANRIKAVAGKVNGVSSLIVEPIRKVDEIHIKLRPDDLSYHGLDRETVNRFIQTALHGERVSQVVEGQRRFDLVVRLDDAYRADVANLGDLMLSLPPDPKKPDDFRYLRLKEIADITPPTGGDAGANQVKRENARRRIVVRCNALGRDLSSVVTDIQAAVSEKVTMPEGYFVEYGGQFESQRTATRLIMVLAGVSGVGMFLVLLLLFPSVRIVLQILNAVPTAFIGGVIALVVTGQTLTVASLVGFISLGGIAVRNGILLVTHYVHLMRSEGEGFTKEMVMRGSLERLAPVLMTALTAGIGLIPLVVEGQKPGREILYPVATVILGGLITSTFCEFLIHPGLFWRFSGKDGLKLASKNSSSDGLDESPASLTPSTEN
ncbi:MAG: efflux RND transporter permease subunit [Fimbriiglobus sp.]|jgi:HME family heavy-metal exporter|nr:efflux RND transporter permease subunit [Fimbriiglobus sp.]